MPAYNMKQNVPTPTNTDTVGQASSQAGTSLSSRHVTDSLYRYCTLVSIPCALQDMYTELAWTDEALSPFL